MEPRTLRWLLIGFRPPLLPPFYRRLSGICTGVPYLSRLRRVLPAGRGLPHRSALSGGAARRLLLRPIRAKSDALKLHILFFPLLFPVVFSLCAILLGFFQESKNGFLGLFLNLLFTSLLDLRLHQLLLDFCQG